MGEKFWAATAPVLLIVLAGCSGSGGQGGGGDDTTPPPVVVDDTTCGIRGVVVDEGIRPIANADVRVIGTTLAMNTDEAGNFAFSKVAPGTYFVQAKHGLYDTQQQSTDCIAGDADPDPVRILLRRVVFSEPYIITLPYDGFISCSAGQETIGYSEECGEGVGVPCIGLPDPIPCGRVGGQSNNEVQFDFFVDNLNVSTVLLEMYWEPTVSSTATGELLTVVSTEWVCDPFCGGNTFTCASGPSPLYGRADLINGSLTPPEGLACGFIRPNDSELTTLGPITAFTWTNPSHCEPMPVGDCQYTPSVVVEQPYQLFMTLSYYLPLPECWSFINGDDDPFRPGAPANPNLC